MSKVAVVQSASVLLDRERTVEKVVSLIQEAATEGAKLILFPEALISGYPRYLGFGAVVGSRSAQGRRQFQEYWDSAVEVPSAATLAIGNAARAANAFVAVGIIERDATFQAGRSIAPFCFSRRPGIFSGSIAS